MCCVGAHVEMPLPEHLKGIFVNDRSLYDIASDLVAKGKAALPTPPSMVSVGYKASGGIPVKYRRDMVRSKTPYRTARAFSLQCCSFSQQHAARTALSEVQRAAAGNCAREAARAPQFGRHAFQKRRTELRVLSLCNAAVSASSTLRAPHSVRFSVQLPETAQLW